MLQNQPLVIPTIDQEILFEQLISGLFENNYGCTTDIFSPSLINNLRNNLLGHLEANEMQAAGIGTKVSYVKNTQVRGDSIKWIDNNSINPAEQEFLQTIQLFINYLNTTCYTGINDFEFHYAYYEVGSFYKRHLDQFKSNHGRKYSFVTYLNDDWTEENNGTLSLYTNDDDVKILPVGGKSIFFKSDEIEHEVHPANRMRLSIAGWLKQV